MPHEDTAVRARLDSSDDEGNAEAEEKRPKEKRKKKKKEKSHKKHKKHKKKKRSKRKHEDDEQGIRPKKRRQDGEEGMSPETMARMESILSEIEANPDPEFIAAKMSEDVEFAAMIARNQELAAALAEKANAHIERLAKEEEDRRKEEEKGAEKPDEDNATNIDLERAKLEGCGDHPDEVKRMVSFKPLADAKKAKALHSAAMTLDDWVKKKAELAEAEKQRFLAQGNVLGRVKCRHCKGPHWSAACPTLKKHVKKEDSIGSGGGYKKPFWNCLKCGAENSNKRKHDCYKCGALWRSGWAKSGQSW
ncbi:hypothetical protein AAMO2058_001200800 [Amorphochlora amoebiformis]